MPRGRGVAYLYGTAALVYGLDRFTKAWAEAVLGDGRTIEAVPGILRFSLTRNTGGAFSFAQHAPVFFAVVTILIAGLIVAISFRPHPPSTAVPLGMVLGGALGNLTDRIANGPGLTGGVTDFVDIRVLPLFNVADSGIVLGAITLVLLASRETRRTP